MPMDAAKTVSTEEENPYEEANQKTTSSFKTVRLPFKEGTSFIVSQGAFGRNSHNEPGNEYNWDLSVPYGTEVIAIEGGKVIEVWQPRKGGGCEKKYSDVAHNIKIEHADGTVAQYVHIETDKKIGDQVEEGQLIKIDTTL